MKTRKTRPFEDLLMEQLSDPEVASLYVNAALEESKEEFLIAMKEVARASQMSRVAKESGIQRETLYRSLSEQGNPTWYTLLAIMEVVGIKFTTVPIHKISKTRRRATMQSLHPDLIQQQMTNSEKTNVATKQMASGLSGFNFNDAALGAGYGR